MNSAYIINGLIGFIIGFALSNFLSFNKTMSASFGKHWLWDYLKEKTKRKNNDTIRHT